MAKRSKTSVAKAKRVALGAASKSNAKGAPNNIPPAVLAPEATPPISTKRTPGSLAPWPVNDRTPTVAGQALSLSYLSATFRTALTGYRQQFVDVLNELLEADPHLYSVVQKRILSVANGRVEIVPADLPEDHPDKELASEVADMVSQEIGRIPDLTKSLAELSWAIYYGISASEIHWTRDADGWHVDRLGFIHNRRIAYPDYQSWDVYIWDQGQVYGWQTGWDSPTNSSTFGLRVADWPGKFIVHTPQLRGDYPTRDGIGRQTATWALLKRIGGRGASSYLERFAKGFMDVAYSTTKEGRPREATEDDIALATQIAAQIGPGSGSYAVHADSVSFTPKSYEGTGTARLTWSEWIALCNGEMSKAALGGTLTTDHSGSGGLGGDGVAQAQERGEADLEQYDATTLGQSIRRDLVSWLVRLNRPDAMHVVPQVLVHVEVDPDPKSILDNAMTLVKAGAPVDADDLCDKVGIKLIENKTGRARRLFMSDVVDPTAVDDTLLSDEAKAQKQQALEAQQSLAEAKAKAPTLAPANSNGKPPSNEGSDDIEAKADKKLSDSMRAVLMADRADKGPALQVFDQLCDDYPAKHLGWVLAAHWEGPEMVPLSSIDFSSRSQWRASHDGTIDQYASKIDQGRIKPVILVRHPSNPKLEIIDGHHRTLASEKLGRDVLAYVATVHSDHGPWSDLHDLQKKGSSKADGSSSWLPASWLSRAKAAVNQ